MLFKQKTLSEIKSGKVTLAFRKWKRPTVKAGGTLLTPVGLLSINSVEIINRNQITEIELSQAGIQDQNELDKLLGSNRPGVLYRISFHLSGEDPRIALRQKDDFTELEFKQILNKLQGYDTRSKYGDWTERTLQCISRNPSKRAVFLAELLQLEKAWLKTQIRKLKNLGLTISLPIGYKISLRGQKILQKILNNNNKAG